mgnify:FL=1
MSAAAVGALPNWPFLGVSVACLRAFARAHEALLVDATTEDVCERVCKPLTETAGDSLAACLVRLGAADPVTGVPLAAAPTIFVSHARKYLDIFSQYQHWIGDVGTAQRPCNWDVVFQLTTAAIGHTCLVFAPWRDAVPLRRAWMLWEVLCTLTAQGTKGAASSALRVRLPPAESDDFQAALVGEFDVIAASVARIDSRSAECFTREDQAMVHAAIDRTLKGGHTELDARLSEALREWLAAEGRAALARMPRDERATSLMQNRLGSLLKDQGKLDEAEPLFREALEVQRATLGDWHPDTLASINNLGNLLKVQGKHDEAEPLLRQALEVQRATLGDRHPDTLGSIHNLGLLLKDQGKLDEAEPLVREALEAMRATLGDRHPHTLATINNLGNLLQDQGKLDKAEPLLREALEARRALLGGRHPVTLSSINNLGTLLKVQGKRDEAEPLLREALEAMRATLGNRHPHTLASIGNLGTLLQAQGKLDEAEPLKRKAFEVRRATLGDRHPDTLGSIHNLGTLLLAQGKLDEAEPLVREALEVQRATLGDRHPDTLGSINNLGTLLQDQGKLDEAEPLVREALEAMRATLGDRHPHTLASIGNLGTLLQAQGKLDEAEPLKRKALEVRRATLGDRHPDTLGSINNLGTLLQDQGKLDEAEPLVREALEAMRATLGDRHPHTLASIGNLGTLLQDQGKLDEAEPLLREALEARRATLGDRHPQTLTAIHNLGSLLATQGMLDEALPLVVEHCRATLGDQHPDTLNFMSMQKDMEEYLPGVPLDATLVDEMASHLRQSASAVDQIMDAGAFSSVSDLAPPAAEMAVWRRQQSLGVVGFIFESETPHARLELGTRVLDIGDVENGSDSPVYGTVVGWTTAQGRFFDTSAGCSNKNGCVRVYYDKKPAAHDGNPWNVMAAGRLLFLDAAAPDPPHDTLTRPRPPEAKGDYDGVTGSRTGGGRSRNQKEHMRAQKASMLQMLQLARMAHEAASGIWNLDARWLEIVTGDLNDIFMAAAKSVTRLEALLNSPECNPNVRDASGASPLWHACRAGSLECTRLLLDRGADVQIQPRGELSPLGVAARNGFVVCVQLLLEHRASLEAVDEERYTPLFAAVRGAHSSCVEALINARANLECKTEPLECTPLGWLCCVEPNLNLPILQLLLRGRANVDTHQFSSFARSMTPLAFAVLGDRTDAIKWLLANGANVHLTDADGDPPTLLACIADHSECCRLLLGAKADGNYTRDDGTTLLNAAAHGGSFECVQILLEHGAAQTINKMDRIGTHPMHWACQDAYPKILELLCKAKADVENKNGKGGSPLLLALTYEEVRKDVKLECVRILIEHKVDVNAIDPRDGESPLGFVSKKGSIEAAALLLKAGATATIGHKDHRGAHPMHWACQEANPPLLKLLIEAKGNVEQPNGKGGTPLMLATCDPGPRNVECLRMLLKAKADPNQLDHDGDPAIIRTMIRDDEAQSAALLEAGARANATDHHGISLVQRFGALAQPKMLRLLIQHGADVSGVLDLVQVGFSSGMVKKPAQDQNEVLQLLRDAPSVRARFLEEQRVKEQAERSQQESEALQEVEDAQLAAAIAASLTISGPVPPPPPPSLAAPAVGSLRGQPAAENKARLALEQDGFALQALRPETDARLLRSLEALLQTEYPEWLGKGKDVSKKYGPYDSLKLACAWKVDHPRNLDKYTTGVKRVQQELELLERKGKNVSFVPGLPVKTDRVRGLTPSEACNEVILLHGTNPDRLFHLLSTGLNERYSGTGAGTAFGDGVYLAEDVGKTDQYVSADSAYDPSSDLHKRLYGRTFRHPGDVFYVLVVRAALGYPVRTQQMGPKATSMDNGAPIFPVNFRELSAVPGVTPPICHHSLIAELGQVIDRYREFVLFHSEYVHIDYVIAYHRCNGGQKLPTT